MCGIGGIYQYSQKSYIDEQQLQLMNKSLELRGPDGFGHWVAEKKQIGLTHRRLSIIDLSDKASQPMVSADGRFVITYNGEIYNYQDLRQDLIKQGESFVSTSDTEVILKLFEKHKEKSLNFLRGMFAFAIWDNHKEKLFVARDHFGIKPLYYCDQNQKFVFGSTVSAVLKGLDKSPGISLAGKASFYLWGHVQGPWTIYQDIFSLRPGHYCWVDKSGVRDFNYFDLTKELSLAEKKSNGLSLEEALGKAEQAIIESLNYHFVSDVEVGIFLSAGMDSSSLLAMAFDQGKSNLNAFTLSYDEFKNSERDETPLAMKIAQKYKAQHQVKIVDFDYFNRNIDDFFKCMDQPTIDGVNTFFVSRQVRDKGMKVALSGLGGDEIFAGYNSFEQIPTLVKWMKLFGLIPFSGYSIRKALSVLPFSTIGPKTPGIIEYGQNVSSAYLLRRALFMPWELNKVMGREKAKQGLEELMVNTKLDRDTFGIKDDSLKITALEIKNYMSNQLLKDSDWAGMGNSIEIRVPLVDIGVFRSFLEIYNQGIRVRKKDLIKVIGRNLPKEVWSRPKTGFGIPVETWSRKKYHLDSKERGLRGWAKLVLEKKLNEA